MTSQRLVFTIVATLSTAHFFVCVKADLNYYEVLGVDQAATRDDIAKAFRNLGRQYHPDKNKNPNAEKIFWEIGRAYMTLSNEQKRDIYDIYGEKGLNAFYSNEEALLFSTYGLEITKWMLKSLSDYGVDKIVRYVLTSVGLDIIVLQNFVARALTYLFKTIFGSRIA